MAKKEYSVQEIIGSVAAGKIAPIYFFMGDEPYYIDFLTDYIMDHIPMSEEEKAFDETIIYGADDMSAGKILSVARSYPMMGKYQVVLVKEAQKIRNFEEDITPYVLEPMPSTILIINYKGKTIDKRRKLASEIASKAVLYESKKLYDNQIPSWIVDYLRGEGLQIENKAAQMLADFLGTDLGRIVGELNKLKIVMPKGTTTVTPEIVERNIGISKDYNNFELIDAVKVKNYSKALMIAKVFGQSPKQNPLILTIVTLYDFFSKLLIYQYLADKSQMAAASKMGVAPFTVRNYEMAAKCYSVRKTLENISTIREFDARSKGFAQTTTDDGELLRELLCRLMA